MHVVSIKPGDVSAMIRNLEELLALPSGSTITEQKINRLTAPGENYGSLVLSVDLKIESPSGTEQLALVAKTVPPNPYLRKLFHSPITFRKEIVFYQKIVPLLQKFQREQGVREVLDITPRYYGGRLNLCNNDVDFDNDAVLLLENLQPQRYSCPDRFIGCDLETSKLILANLAVLHAVPLALKLQKPMFFEREVKKYLAPWPLSQQFVAQMKQQIDDVLENVPEIGQCKDKILKAFDRRIERDSDRWATISHNDCWINNTMVQVIDNKVTKSKIVDFQGYDLGPPARDVVFFLFTSIQATVLDSKYEYLLEWYYERFARTMEELNCSSQEYPWREFLEEVENEAKVKFLHLFIMMFPVFAPVGSVPEMEEISEKDFRGGDLSILQKEKLIWLVDQFMSRNWI